MTVTQIALFYSGLIVGIAFGLFAAALFNDGDDEP